MIKCKSRVFLMLLFHNGKESLILKQMIGKNNPNKQTNKSSSFHVMSQMSACLGLDPSVCLLVSFCYFAMDQKAISHRFLIMVC